MEESKIEFSVLSIALTDKKKEIGALYFMRSVKGAPRGNSTKIWPASGTILA